MVGAVPRPRNDTLHTPPHQRCRRERRRRWLARRTRNQRKRAKTSPSSLRADCRDDGARSRADQVAGERGLTGLDGGRAGACRTVPAAGVVGDLECVSDILMTQADDATEKRGKEGKAGRGSRSGNHHDKISEKRTSTVAVHAPEGAIVDV